MLMGSEHQEDVFDYVMSDTFISDTRSSPYRTGFRSRHHPQRPSIPYLLSLCDQEFAAYCRNGCRLPSASPNVHAELEALRTELHALRAEILAMRYAGIKATPNSSALRGGLNVPPRP
jgi:hypothetical protein